MHGPVQVHRLEQHSNTMQPRAGTTAQAGRGRGCRPILPEVVANLLPSVEQKNNNGHVSKGRSFEEVVLT